jgi:type IV pilus assembly protein PilB
MEGITQVQINPKAGLSFATGLRSMMRADPDIIMVGEIRDRETAQIAIESALTGHMVLSTLHTNDAPTTVTRLVEMGIEPFLVASSIDCVVAQRLARVLCPQCKRRTILPAATLQESDFHAPYDVEAYEPEGMKRLRDDGLEKVRLGRTSIEEVSRVTGSG